MAIQITATEERVYRTLLFDKSDKELESIFLKNNTIVASLPDNANNDQLTKAKHLLKEAKVARMILEEREKDRENRRIGFIKFKKYYELKKIERRLNLRYASTPNGQLIASILEDEDGKTLEELNSWCDELEIIEENEFKMLLDGLVEEGIIEKKDDKYYLVSICLSSLSSSNTMNKVMDKLKDHYSDNSTYIILKCLNIKGPGITKYDINSYIDTLKESMNNEFSEEDLSHINETRIMSSLSCLQRDNIIEAKRFNDNIYYYFTLIEKQNKENISYLEKYLDLEEFEVTKLNEYYKKEIISILLKNNKKMTILEIQEEMDDEMISNQKLAFLVRQLIKEGYVLRTVEGRRAYFEINPDKESEVYK